MLPIGVPLGTVSETGERFLTSTSLGKCFSPLNLLPDVDRFSIVHVQQTIVPVSFSGARHPTVDEFVYGRV